MKSLFRKILHYNYEKTLLFLYLLTLFLLCLIHISNQNTTFAYIDEATYLQNVGIIQKYGFSAEMIRHYIGPPGPLYGIIHYTASFLTHNLAAYTRFTTLLLFLALIWETKKLLALFKFQNSGLISLTVLVIPITYMCAGISLTEVPAMLCVVIAFRLFLSTNLNDWNFKAVFYSVLAGFVMSLGILGRQNFLVILAAFPILLLPFPVQQNKIIHLFFFIISALVLPLKVFSIWGGIIPPMNYEANQGLVIWHGFLAFQYATIFVVMLAPSWLLAVNRKKIFWGILIFGIIFFINYTFSIFEFLPVKIITEKSTSPTIKQIISSCFVSAAILSTIYFLLSTYYQLKKELDSPQSLMIIAAFLLLTATCAMVSHMFGSRYVWLGMPFLLVMIAKHIRFNLWLFCTSMVGILVGLYSLLRWIEYQC